MPIYTVKAGDTMAKIAKAHQLPGPATIHDHPENAEYKKKRPNPDILLAGEEIHIPDPEKKSVAKPTEQRHVFKKPAKEGELNLRLLDGAMQPRKGVAYDLIVKNGPKYKGKTDGDGKLKHPIPIEAEEATLKCPEGVYTLKIGHLDPIEELEGVKERLQNLGFKITGIDRSDDAAFRSAVKAFQQMNLSSREASKNDGTLDKETRDKIKEIYGC